MFPKIAGTLVSGIDHPNRIALVVYLPYCNYRCLWCHNYELVLGRFKEVPLKDLRWELENNLFVDMVVITGGEPTIYGDGLIELIKFVKEVRADLPVRVDTNGSRPDVMRDIVDLVDGFAVDVKAPPQKKELYSRIIGRKFDREAFMESVRIACDLSLTLFRTVRYPILTDEDFSLIRKFLNDICPDKPYYINEFVFVNLPSDWRAEASAYLPEDFQDHAFYPEGFEKG